MKMCRDFNKQQKGQILIITMIVVALCSLIVVPLVNYMGTGLRAVNVYHKNTNELYAADTGIQYAMWKIKYDSQINTDRSSGTYQIYPPYTLPDANHNTVSVQVSANWLFSYLFKIPLGETPKNENLNTTCTSGSGIYTIKFENMDIPDGHQAQNIHILKMGIWLPPGFSYVNNSCVSSDFQGFNLNAGNILTSELVYGGTNLIWDFGNPGCPLGRNDSATLQFQYTPAGSTPRGASAWVFPSQTSVGASWNDSVWWYDVTSTAVDNSVSPSKTTVIKAVIVYDDTNGAQGSTIISYLINP